MNNPCLGPLEAQAMDLREAAGHSGPRCQPPWPAGGGDQVAGARCCPLVFGSHRFLGDTEFANQRAEVPWRIHEQLFLKSVKLVLVRM